MTHFFDNKQVLMENVSFQDLTLLLSSYCLLVSFNPSVIANTVYYFPVTLKDIIDFSYYHF